MPTEEITAAQCKAARGLLGWKSKDLAQKALVGINTVTRFEAGNSVEQLTIARLKQAFENAGIEFIEDGVRIKPNDA
jgi:transcriptional regulator with XRE-family HTH domain